MNKKSWASLGILSVLILALSALLVYRLFFYNMFRPTVEIKVIDKIDGYSYKLEDRDTSLYETEFNELKKILKTKDYDEEAYAKSLVKLFVIDFYTLDNKLNKYDVGGLDFIKEDDQDTFKSKAMDSYYKNVLDNTYDNRKTKYPIVTKVSVDNIENTPFKINNKSNDAFLLDVTWEYDKTYEASKHAMITVLIEENLLSIVNIETIKAN